MAKTIGSFDLASLKNLRDDVTQYFWFESDSSSAWGSGAHVTLYPESQFTNPNHANYLKGQNIIMNTDGFSIRNGGLPMMVLDNDSLDFNAVDTSLGTYTTMATFGLSGMRIYSRNSANNIVQLANIGYGEGQSQSGTSVAPYYTFGVRQTTTTAYSSSSTYNIGDMCVYDEKVYVCLRNITTPEPWNASHWEYYIGNHSMASGYSTTASGYGSHAEGGETIASGYGSHAEGSRTIASETTAHAEGGRTIASGARSHAEGCDTIASAAYSHAEGEETIASGQRSHAEGYGTVASGQRSHAEGHDTIANGWSSHAQNYGTIAQTLSQTVIGEYNLQDTAGSIVTRGDYAFIIGNGNGIDGDPNERSNAFTVDWDGNVEAAGDVICSNIGDYLNDIGSDRSCATGKHYQMAHLTLPPGTWILAGSVRISYANNTTGVRRCFITTDDSNYDNVTDQPSVLANLFFTQFAASAFTNGVCHIKIGTGIVRPIVETTYRLIGYQNSGNSVSGCNGRLYALRIK